MSTDPSPSTRTAPRVVAVVTADDAELLVPCLDAIQDQVYGPARVFVVGGSDDVRAVAGKYKAAWRPNLRGVHDALGGDVTFVWALRQRARPEPGALAALIRDGERVDASVAGSKVVDVESPEVLVSVGYATDVFCAPYSGLQPGELDQAQFDVIRDVAAVSDTSMLIRRDLFRGLGGVDPRMPSTSAAVDFCQRARLRGGRVVVIPSSVVGYQGPDPAPRWRERAGEIRAMIKAYGPMTLLWSLPVSFLVGIVESVLGLFVGRFALPGVLAAWLWNLARLPSAFKARFQARRGREVGDEELFRYQVAGSARLRMLWDEVAQRMRARFPEGVLSGFSDAVEAGQQRIRTPSFFIGLLVVVFGLVATREIWTERLPVVGFSLPPPESPLDALRSYAGGWNPAGLGSPEVLRPDIAATAVIQLLAFANGGVAVSIIVVGSFIFGAFGMSRLLQRWGLGPSSGLLAGLVLMAGPGMVALGGMTRWTSVAAVAAVPWALQAAYERRGGVRALVTVTVAVGVAAVYAPAALPVTWVAAALWVLVGRNERVGPLLVVSVATIAAVPLLVPWLLYADLPGFLSSGPDAFWEPSIWVVGFVAVACVAVLLIGDAVLTSVAGWGGLATVLGAAAARTGSIGGGAEVGTFGLILVAIGTAAIAGAALEAGVRRKAWGGLSALSARAALLSSVVLVISTLLLAGPGRAGLPQDALSESFRFAAAGEGASTRILMFGPAETLPGETRTLDGLHYRVMVPPYPAAWEAYLNEPRLGDQALQAALTDIVEGRVRRAGDVLADFGIAWVVFTEPSPLEQLFEAQLDLVPLRSLDFPVFRNEVAAYMAVSDDGRAWAPHGTGFVAPGGASGTVYLAANADYRWGPGSWEQAEWATSVSSNPGTLSFSAYSPRRLMAMGAGVWALGLVSLMFVNRRRPS